MIFEVIGFRLGFRYWENQGSKREASWSECAVGEIHGFKGREYNLSNFFCFLFRDQSVLLVEWALITEINNEVWFNIPWFLFREKIYVVTRDLIISFIVQFVLVISMLALDLLLLLLKCLTFLHGSFNCVQIHVKFYFCYFRYERSKYTCNDVGKYENIGYWLRWMHCNSFGRWLDGNRMSWLITLNYWMPIVILYPLKLQELEIYLFAVPLNFYLCFPWYCYNMKLSKGCLKGLFVDVSP